MSKINYYAVRAGHTPGVYKTWEECKAQTVGFKGAVYKGFATESDAQEWIKLEGGYNTPREVVPATPVDGDYAYTDGSFNSETNTYGYGIVLSLNGVISTHNGSGNKYPAHRNIAGEMCGAMKAVQLAYNSGSRNITLFYDYVGIKHWADGTWKRNGEATETYHGFMQEYIRKGMKVDYFQIPGHSGIYGNELADKLAKEAVGIK